MRDIIRKCRFAPYRRELGLPTFRLTVWDTGKSCLGYELVMVTDGAPVVLFTGEDFGCSPLYAIDSDETMGAIMGFLTLRPGDTDSEYFANYTPEQLEYCSQHAEALSCEVFSRWGDV